jgi:hypothetical protein
MTVRELAKRLDDLPGDTVIRLVDHDSEWMFNYVYGVHGINDDGYIRKSHILDSYSDFPEDYEDE